MFNKSIKNNFKVKQMVLKNKMFSVKINMPKGKITKMQYFTKLRTALIPGISCFVLNTLLLVEYAGFRK